MSNDPMSSAVENSGATLLRASEVDQLDAEDPLKRTLDWVRTFVAMPHPELGRAGAVCPFIPHALEIDSVWLTSVRIPSEGLAGSDAQLQVSVDDAIDAYRQQFPTLEPYSDPSEIHRTDAIFKTVILVFPDVSADDAPRVVDEAQFRLKPRFVDDALMLGQFHANNAQEGIHNPDFRPLRSPIPLLVIRWMVGNDRRFLLGDLRYPAKQRFKFMRSFLK